MTLVVAFVSKDGAVMAADSQWTEADGTRNVADKIWLDHGFLFGYSGTGAVRQRLLPEITGAIKALPGGPRADRAVVRDALTAALRPVVAAAYQGFVPITPDQNAGAIAGWLLVVGRDGAGYWILEIDPNLNGSLYADRGFHTVGSGAQAAQVSVGLLQAYEHTQRSVEHLQLIAYRTVRVCINVMAHFLSDPIRLWSSDGKTGFTELTDSEMAALEEALSRWGLVESDTLDEVLQEPGGQRPAGVPTSPPPPPPSPPPSTAASS